MAVIWAMLPNDGVAIVTDWFVNKVVEICCHLPHSRDHEMAHAVLGHVAEQLTMAGFVR